MRYRSARGRFEAVNINRSAFAGSRALRSQGNKFRRHALLHVPRPPCRHFCRGIERRKLGRADLVPLVRRRDADLRRVYRYLSTLLQPMFDDVETGRVVGVRRLDEQRVAFPAFRDTRRAGDSFEPPARMIVLPIS